MHFQECESVDLLVIAGEASGDEHAAKLIKDLRQRKPNLVIRALGGSELEKQQVDLLFNLVDHAVVGIFEVLKNYAFFRKIFNETLRWISENRPKTILLVDYPGFNLRVAEALREKNLSKKGGGEIVVLQYVSPQLWAWKAKRRFKMEKILDSLGVIFPFELDCYKDVELPVSFVGHPMVEMRKQELVKYDSNGPVLLLPGSREQAIERIFPILLDAFEKLVEEFPKFTALVPASNMKTKNIIQKILASRKDLLERVEVSDSADQLSARLVWTSSGTMSLRCAISGIPGLIVYKAHPLTYLIGRALVKVKYLGMANLLLPEDPPYPEYIQNRAIPNLILGESRKILSDEKASSRRSNEIAQKLTKLLKGSQERGGVEWLLDEGSLG